MELTHALFRKMSPPPTSPTNIKLLLMPLVKMGVYLNLLLQLISYNFSLNVANFIWNSNNCEVQKFILEFTSRFVNKTSD